MRIKVKIKSKKRKDSKIVAKVAIFTDDDSVLLLKRSNYLKKHKGEWDLPGGHILQGEEITAGLSREVREEADLELTDPQFVFKEGRDCFFMDEWNGTRISLSNEHNSFIFYNANQINDLKSLTSYYKTAILKCYKAFKDKPKND